MKRAEMSAGKRRRRRDPGSSLWLRLTPCWLNGRREGRWLTGLLIACLIWAPWSFSATIEAEVLAYARIMPSGITYRFQTFAEIAGSALLPMALLAAAMPFLAAWHYLGHRQGGRSDYLMRRLPDRWEFHRRCLSLPALFLAAALLLTAVLLLLFFAAYRRDIPPEAMVPVEFQGPLYRGLDRLFS